MGIIKLSLVSLKKDFKKSVFYFFTFLLTTIFIFSFFNLVFNPSTGIDLGKDDATFTTPIAVFVIVIAMICVFLANNFYVSNKGKEISIILMSGASVYQVGVYLFLQVFLIMLCAIPLGCLLGIALVPVINAVMATTFVYHGTMFYISERTMIATGAILGFEVLWCTMLNLGYCVRSTVTMMMHSQNKVELYGIKGPQFSNRLFIILYFIPPVVFLFIHDSMSFFLFALIGVVGILGIIKKVLPDYIKEKQRSDSLNNPVQLIAYGFFHSDIQKVFGLLIIVLLSSILLTCAIVYTLKQPLVSMIALMSYVSVMILMSLTIVFKIGMELNTRKDHFVNLCRLGFSIKQIKEIVCLEMRLFYGLLLVMPLFYQIIILINLLISSQITIQLVSIILIIQIIPISLSYLLSMKLYAGIIPQSIVEQK